MNGAEAHKRLLEAHCEGCEGLLIGDCGGDEPKCRGRSEFEAAIDRLNLAVVEECTNCDDPACPGHAASLRAHRCMIGRRKVSMLPRSKPAPSPAGQGEIQSKGENE